MGPIYCAKQISDFSEGNVRWGTFHDICGISGWQIKKLAQNFKNAK